MFVTTDGKIAYFCSDKLDGIGGWDLYSFDLYKDIQPERVLFLKGEIRDDNGELVDSVNMQFKNTGVERSREAPCSRWLITAVSPTEISRSRVLQFYFCWLRVLTHVWDTTANS